MKKTVAEFIEELKQLEQDKPISMWDYQLHTWHTPIVRKYNTGDQYMIRGH